jgi:hypothetical protein
MATLLVGTNTPPNESASNSLAVYFKYICIVSGNCNEFRVKPGENGDIKCAIYTDNAGEPGTLLWVQNTAQAVTADVENTIAVSPAVALTKDTYYWLAWAFLTNKYYFTNSTAGVYRYKYLTTLDSFVDNPTGLGSLTYDCYVAGWGTAIAVGRSFGFIIG